MYDENTQQPIRIFRVIGARFHLCEHDLWQVSCMFRTHLFPSLGYSPLLNCFSSFCISLSFFANCSSSSSSSSFGRFVSDFGRALFCSSGDWLSLPGSHKWKMERNNGPGEGKERGKSGRAPDSQAAQQPPEKGTHSTSLFIEIPKIPIHTTPSEFFTTSSTILALHFERSKGTGFAGDWCPTPIKTPLH